jgi:hypothetical protein
MAARSTRSRLSGRRLFWFSVSGFNISVLGH